MGCIVTIPTISTWRHYDTSWAYHQYGVSFFPDLPQPRHMFSWNLILCTKVIASGDMTENCKYLIFCYDWIIIILDSAKNILSASVRSSLFYGMPANVSLICTISGLSARWEWWWWWWWYYYYYSVVVYCHWPFLPGTSERTMISTAPRSNFRLQYIPYYVRCS